MRSSFFYSGRMNLVRDSCNSTIQVQTKHYYYYVIMERLNCLQLTTLFFQLSNIRHSFSQPSLTHHPKKPSRKGLLGYSISLHILL